MKAGFESLGRLRFQAVALLTATFLVGVVVGVAGERVRTSHTPLQRPFGMEPGVIPAIYQRLDLTEAQREAIRTILARHRPQTDSVLGEMLPRLRGMADSVRREIHQILTPEQREKLRELGPAAPFDGPPGRPHSPPRPPMRNGPPNVP